MFFDSQDFQIILLSLNVLLNPGNEMSTNTPAELFVFSSNFLIISLHYLNSFTGRKYSNRLDIEVSALFEHQWLWAMICIMSIHVDVI